MPSLQTVGRRFESELYTETGYPFPGVIEPLDEGAVASYDFTEPRLILRVRHDCPVVTGSHLMDPAGRKYIMANHDVGLAYDQTLYKTHRLFLCNKTVLWERDGVGTTDPLTGLKVSDGARQNLGTIDVLIEQYGREQTDVQIRIAEQRRRLVTSSPVQLGDLIDNMLVRRVDAALGIWIAEIE
jgi:hypothetical protein